MARAKSKGPSRKANTDRVAVEKALNNAVPPAETDQQAIDRLARLPPLAYEKVREAEAVKLKSRVSILDGAVTARRKEIAAENSRAHEKSEAVEPWEEPVRGAELLDEIRACVKHHVVLPNHGDVITSLWITMTYVLDAFETAPNLAAESAEPGCGKSTLMSLLFKLCLEAILASSITGPTIFRIIDLKKPTLLIDEADTFVHLSDELRGILNCGHTKDTAKIWRCDGDDHTPRQFLTWCPKAFALIGELPATLQARSIVLRLRRKLPHEVIAKVKSRDKPRFLEMRRKLARWAQDNFAALSEAEPTVPASLENRVSDNWLPLIAIADAAGGNWPELALEAASAVVAESAKWDEPTISSQLLADMQSVFKRFGAVAASSKMHEELIKLPDAPWADYSHGKPISTRRIAMLMKNYEIKPHQNGTGSYWKREDFAEVFKRYLSTPPPNTAIVPQTQETSALQPHKSATGSDERWQFENRENPAKSYTNGSMALREGGEPESEGADVTVPGETTA